MPYNSSIISPLKYPIYIKVRGRLSYHGGGIQLVPTDLILINFLFIEWCDIWINSGFWTYWCVSTGEWKKKKQNQH